MRRYILSYLIAFRNTRHKAHGTLAGKHIEHYVDTNNKSENSPAILISTELMMDKNER